MIADSARITAAWDDLLERDGQALVLAGNDVTLLSPLASAAVQFCAEGGVTVAELAAYLVAEFGVPSGFDPAQAVRDVLIALQERGVVTITH